MKEFFKDYGLLIVFAINTLTSAVVLWYRRNVATKDDVSAAVKEARQHTDDSCKALAVSLSAEVSRSIAASRIDAPNREDVSNLRLEIERARGDIRTFTAEMEGSKNTVRAEVEGVRGLVQRAENMLGILTENAIRGGGD